MDKTPGKVTAGRTAYKLLTSFKRDRTSMSALLTGTVAKLPRYKSQSSFVTVLTHSNKLLEL